MASFPTSIYSPKTINGSVDLRSTSDSTHDTLSAHLTQLGNEVVALETKAGISGSAVTTSDDYRISALEGQLYSPLSKGVLIGDDFTAQSNIGSINWKNTAASSATITVLNVTDTNWNTAANAIYGAQLLNLASTASTNAQAELSLVHVLQAGLGPLDMTFRLGWNIVPPSGVSTLSYYFGIQDKNTFNNKIQFLMTSSGLTSVAEKAGTSTTDTISGTYYTFTAYQMNTFHISINAAWTSVGYYINGVLADTITTNIPTLTGANGLQLLCGVFDSAATNTLSTQPVVCVDYIGIRYQYAR